MQEHILTSYRVSAPVAPYRLLAFTEDGVIAQASSSKSRIIACSDSAGQKEKGQHVFVAHGGFQEVELGGPVKRDDYLTSDSQGRGVTAIRTPGEVVFTGGIALEDGTEGAVIKVLIVPGDVR